jgi:DNA-binding IscR family transcriptional regulator
MLQVRDAIATVLDQCTLADMRSRARVDREALFYQI